MNANTQRVLLIDDHTAFTRLLKLTLQRSGGHVVCEENDSTQAWLAARKFQPDIVFCDIDMPGIDGGEVARQIRSDPSLEHVPIIFLSTLVGSEDCGTAIAGFPFLAKPVAVASVLRCIAEHTAVTS
jgi:chemosensory pili system protein ChpA (sensor histidine kinase/response regulator)